MAKATVREEKRIKAVTLELSAEEADLVACVLGGFIGGDVNGVRRHADAVAGAIFNACGITGEYPWQITNAYSQFYKGNGVDFK